MFFLRDLLKDLEFRSKSYYYARKLRHHEKVHFLFLSKWFFCFYFKLRNHHPAWVGWREIRKAMIITWYQMKWHSKTFYYSYKASIDSISGGITFFTYKIKLKCEYIWISHREKGLLTHLIQQVTQYYLFAESMLFLYNTILLHWKNNYNQKKEYI